MHPKVLRPPLISVVIPAYAAAADIAVALSSVFRQTFTDYEVVVVNDGSPDTPDLEAALAPFRPRLRYLVHANAGAAAARNTAILASRGAFVALLDADDRWEPDFLASQVAYLHANPDCALVYADARISGETPLAGRTFMATAPSVGEVTVESLLRQQCTVLTSTVVVRRECLMRIGLFNPRLRRGHDFELWVRLAWSGYHLAYQRAVLAERRARKNGLSGDPIHELDRACDVFRYLEDTLRFAPRERAALHDRLSWLVDRREIERARSALARGDIHGAQQHLRSVAHPDGKIRLVRMGLRVAPQLIRTIGVISGRLLCDGEARRPVRSQAV
jgi:glycosyltransferase involved in cell wall biosynthesis